MNEITLTIDGIRCVAPEGSTILQAARANGIHIPTLCYLEGIHKFGGCRICVVEQVSPPVRNLQPACMVEAKEGMVIRTDSDRVRDARVTLYQLLIADHKLECEICERGGDCELQQLGRELGVSITDPNLLMKIKPAAKNRQVRKIVL